MVIKNRENELEVHENLILQMQNQKNIMVSNFLAFMLRQLLRVASELISIVNSNTL